VDNIYPRKFAKDVERKFCIGRSCAAHDRPMQLRNLNVKYVNVCQGCTGRIRPLKELYPEWVIKRQETSPERQRLYE